VKVTAHLAGVPIEELIYLLARAGGVFAAVTRLASFFQRANQEPLQERCVKSGSDGTRTRDLRRDGRVQSVSAGFT